MCKLFNMHFQLVKSLILAIWALFIVDFSLVQAQLVKIYTQWNLFNMNYRGLHCNFMLTGVSY